MKRYNSGTFYAISDIGLVRSDNEDSYLAKVNAFGDVLLCVSDGMGGRNKGDFASRFLVNGLQSSFDQLDKKFKNEKAIQKWIYKVVKTINSEIFAKARMNKEYSKMGTTMSLCIISGDLLVTAQVGDSRIYSLENQQLAQLSTDQSYAEYLIHSKKIDEEGAKSHPERHKITNAIGIRKECSVDFKNFMYFGQKIMLCTDGVYNNVSENDLEMILNSSDTPERKCKQLISFANANGGSDNMAIIIWEGND